MSFFTSLKVSQSGLTAERLRVELASANLANAHSTRSTEGGPYRRRDPIIRAVGSSGFFGSELERAIRRVQVDGIRIDPSDPRKVFNPSHPDADENGMVSFPNVRVVEEVTNITNASRAFQANIAALRAGRDMAQRAMRIGRR